MKRQTITATLLATALLIFVFFKFINNKETRSFNITGEWVLDSVYAMHPVADSTTKLLNGSFGDPKNKPSLKFNADSTFSRSSSTDSSSEKYYLRDSVLYVDEGKGYLSYPVKTMTDSLFAFMNKDSVVFILKKK